MATNDVRLEDEEAFLKIQDPSVAHTFLHYFYFDSAEAASAVLELFKSRHLIATMERAADDSSWGVYLRTTEVATPTRLTEWWISFNELASNFHGEYDGWELADA